MFVTFTYLFFFVDVDLRSMCVWTLPWIRLALDATVRDFCECFEKSLYGRNLLLTIQNLFVLLPRDIGFSTNEGKLTQMCRRFLKFAYVVVRVCMGKVYSLLVRGLSRSKTLIPLILSQSGWMLYYNNK